MVGARQPVVVAIDLALALASVSCGVSPAQDPLQLPGGSSIRVEGIGHFLTTSGERILRLTYQTEIPITNLSALRAQAEEVWTLFRPEVEKRGYSIAALSATNQRKARFGISVRAFQGFVITKATGGDWEWHAEKKKRQPKSRCRLTATPVTPLACATVVPGRPAAERSCS